MATKISLTKVFSQHYSTLYDNATKRPSLLDWGLVLGLPVAVAVAAWHFDLRIVAAGQVLAAVSILGGFLFGLLTFVFQLRIGATNDPRVPQGGRMARLLDELFYNVAYTTFVAFVIAGVSLIPMSIGKTVPDKEGVLGAGWSILIMALLTHFALNLAMCIKRTHRAYNHYAQP